MMASSSYARVLVHLRKTSSHGGYQLAKFNECILDNLGLSGDGFVQCHLENNQLLIQCQEPEVSKHAPNMYKIMHPPFCPLHHLDEDEGAALPPEISARGVDVGVAVLVESSDKCLLLTRRAGHMRTFPRVWVPPGGHVETGETLEEAVLRELEEETGLSVTPAERHSCHIVGLWESVYPPVLAVGQPKRHHVVVYLHIVLERSSQQLQAQFKLCPEEVDAAVWLSVDFIKLTVYKMIQGPNKDGEVEERLLDELIPITLVNKDGEHTRGSMEASVLRESDPNNSLLGRISTGSRYALSLWLEQHLNQLGYTQKDLYKNLLYLPESKGESKGSVSPGTKLKPKI